MPSALTNFSNFSTSSGADAYIAGNLGTGSTQEMADWLEYMTSARSSSLANLRRANGRDEPWSVPYFGVGNESWGCGGNMRPEFYADLYRQTAEFLAVPGQELRKIASGGYDARTDWTAVLSQIDSNIDGISHHYYTTPTGVWESKGSATGFGEDQWISTLRRALRVEDHIAAQEVILEQNDPDGGIGIYLDEWGAWYDATPGASALWQQNSLRDAFVAALHFHVFHRHASRVRMANIAQTINVLQSMILTNDGGIVLTPTYHIFKMYIPFQDATFLPVAFTELPNYEHRGDSVPAVSATAARGADGRLYVSLANLDPGQSADVSIAVIGMTPSAVSGEILTAADMDAHNTFAAPATVAPAPFESFSLLAGALRVVLPSKSIVMLALDEE
jgi:alpha-N-arabinofuranosidase